MKRILLLCSVFFMVIAFSATAQRTVSGKVTDDTGEGLPGVNVVIKGTITGTTTDLDGNFRLSVDDGATLIFSYVGFETVELEVGARSVIDLSMSGVTELQEVVVTALGSDRNAREVVYANQSVKGEDLLSTPNKNALEALRGKAAGVKLSTGSGSVGASTRIVLRGEGSLTGNNNALIVIDGVAIDNSTSTGGQDLTLAGKSTSGYADHGNRFNDLNVEDIESLTILKGPSATSLYGSRGSSGVVLITTKKGSSNKDGGMKVGVNSSYSVEEAIIVTERQDKFGQGFGNASFDSGENWSWGPQVDGVVRPWTSPVDSDGDGQLEWLSRPYSAVPDQIKNFFNTGRTMSNAINISGANSGFSYYISYSNVDQKGILDNTQYKRNTVTMSAQAQLSERLRSDFKVSYANVKQNTAQEGSRAFEGNNAYAMALQSPITIPFNELRDYNSPYHDIDGYWGSYSSVNPYFILNEFGNDGNINNVLANLSLSYDIMDGLSVSGRFGTNIVSTVVDTSVPKFTPALQLVWSDNLSLGTRGAKHVSPGEFTQMNQLIKITDIQFLANYTRPLTDDLKLNVSAGYNYFERERERTIGRTQGGLLVEGVYNLNNSTLAALGELDRLNYRIYGLLGNVSVGYRDAVFLEYSARRDVSSTLPAANNGFFYHAAGISTVVNDLVQINDDILTFMKVRASIGQSGKDAPLYALNSTFNSNNEVFLGSNPVRFPINGNPSSSVGNQIGSPDLKPETTTTYEVGADLGLFGERVNIAYTFYHSEHNDQIVQVSLPNTSGYRFVQQNVGLMTNEGHEITLSLRPIYGLVDGLDVELFGSYAKNTNEVVDVDGNPDEVGELSIALYSRTSVSLIAREGLPYGTFKGQTYLYNDAGQVVVDPNTGYPLFSTDEEILGTYQPDYLASFGANVSFKGFGFNILFDKKAGGVFTSNTLFSTVFNGTHISTTEYDRQPYVFPNSVIENVDGNGDGLGTYTPNNLEITEEGFFTVYDAPGSYFMRDASFVKLREIGVSYTLPQSMIGNTPFNSVRLGLFGKNVKFWLPGENNIADPEVNGPGLAGNAGGLETTQTPPSRSFGVNLNLTF